MLFVVTYSGHHTLWLANCATAAEEGDREDDNAKSQRNDWHDFRVVFGERLSNVIELKQRNSADNNQGNTSDLKVWKIQMKTHSMITRNILLAALILSPT